MMIEAQEKRVSRYRRQFDEATDAAQKAVIEAAMHAAAVVSADATGSQALQVLRGQVRAAAIRRSVLNSAGKIARGVMVTALPAPWSADAFDVGLWNLSRLLLTAWRVEQEGGR